MIKAFEQVQLLIVEHGKQDMLIIMEEILLPIFKNNYKRIFNNNNNPIILHKLDKQLHRSISSFLLEKDFLLVLFLRSTTETTTAAKNTEQEKEIVGVVEKTTSE